MDPPIGHLVAMQDLAHGFAEHPDTDEIGTREHALGIGARERLTRGQLAFEIEEIVCRRGHCDAANARFYQSVWPDLKVRRSICQFLRRPTISAGSCARSPPPARRRRPSSSASSETRG